MKIIKQYKPITVGSNSISVAKVAVDGLKTPKYSLVVNGELMKTVEVRTSISADDAATRLLISMASKVKK